MFCLGAMLQVLTHSLGCFYVGRVVAGLGTGASSVLVPVYTAELAPKHIRGKLGGCFQLFVTFGVALSYWVDYAATGMQASRSLGSPPSLQRQPPIGLQLVPGAILGLGMLLVEESPRWLAQVGRREEAYAAIAMLVAVHSPADAGRIDAYGVAAIAAVYMEAFSFNWSWGPLVWLYIGEIFPLKIREVGNAVGSSSQWLFNFAFSRITPYAIANLGWVTFLMYAVLNYAIVLYAFFAVHETGGKSLEEMEIVFGVDGGLPDREGGARPDHRVRLISDYD